MASLRRNTTLRDGDRVTPDRLNALVSDAEIVGITVDDLGDAFKGIFYGPTDPGVTDGRIWWDTAGDPVGLKLAFVTPTNASIATWLYRTPRAEAYYWAATRVSVGTPLYVGATIQDTAGFDHDQELFDGYAFPYVSPDAANTTASGVSPYIVIAMESVAEPGPIKCAWSGIIPCAVHESSVSVGSPLYLDYTKADKLSTDLITSTTRKQLHGVCLHETETAGLPAAFLIWGTGAGFQDIT